MTDWIKIEDQKPEEKQPIFAKIIYMGRVSQIAGCCLGGDYIIFDFYSGTGDGKIIEWKPRELPNLEGSHPWCGIENKGI